MNPTNRSLYGIGIARRPNYPADRVEVTILRRNEDELNQVQDQCVYGPETIDRCDLEDTLECALDDLGSPTYAWIVVGPDALDSHDLASVKGVAARSDYVHVCSSNDEWRRALTSQVNAHATTVRTSIARRVDLTTLPRIADADSAAVGLAVYALERSGIGQSRALGVAS